MATVHEEVRSRYGQVASEGSSCCGGGASACCSSSASTKFGYTVEELTLVPKGADLSLGCGNPTALAGLAEGEVVVDLGSGAGIDCFLAAARVGDSGRVVGVDMTPEMVARARQNADAAGTTNVDFRLGEIEHLPIRDGFADAIISNCVINLSPDKPQVLAEAHRVLKSGGRLMVSDLVLEHELSEELRANMTLLTGCIAGAMLKRDFLAAVEAAGFEDIRVEAEKGYVDGAAVGALATDAGISEDAARQIAANVRSVSVYARKP